MLDKNGKEIKAYREWPTGTDEAGRRTQGKVSTRLQRKSTANTVNPVADVRA